LVPEYPLIRPELPCCISAGTDKKALRDGTNRDHKNTEKSLKGLKQAKDFVQGPSIRRNK
jgi:hypothetical protein